MGFVGELKDCDKICWNDGDVWLRRSAHLNGMWSSAKNPASMKHINGEILTWSNGDVTLLQIMTPRTVQMVIRGTTHTGELKDDDKLYWSDGDVWFHRDAVPSDGLKL